MLNPGSFRYLINAELHDHPSIREFSSNIPIYWYPPYQQYNYFGRGQVWPAKFPHPTDKVILLLPTEGVAKAPTYLQITPVHKIDDTTFSVVHPELVKKLGVVALDSKFSIVDTGEWPEYNRASHRTLNSPITAGKHSGFSILPKSLVTPFKEQVGSDEVGYWNVRQLQEKVAGFGTGHCPGVQLTTKNKIFLYSSKVQILSQYTQEYEEITYIRLGCFGNKTKLLNGSTEENEIARFLTLAASNDIEELLDPEGYQEKLKGIGGKIARYHTGLVDMLKLDTSKLKFFDTVADKLDKEKYLHDKHFAEIALFSQVEALPETAQLKRIEKSYSSASGVLNNYKASINTYVRGIKESDENIRAWTDAIKLHERMNVERQQAIETCQKSSTEQEVLLTSIEKQKAEKLKEREGKVLELRKTIPEIPWVQNLKKTGIVVDEIKYLAGGREYLLSKKPEYFTSADCKILSVEFTTLKPSIISVDPDTTPDLKIVGGPYNVLVKDVGNNLVEIYLKPASITSVIGIVKFNDTRYDLIWHPHTNRIPCDVTPAVVQNLFTNQWQKGCSGNIEGSLWNAFQMKDPQVIILTALAWITHANSLDAWGATYTFFPKPDLVNFDEPAEPEKLVAAATETEMGQFLAGLL